MAIARYSSPENRSQADWRVMPSASPIRAQLIPRALGGDVVGNGAVHVLVSIVGPTIWANSSSSARLSHALSVGGLSPLVV